MMTDDISFHTHQEHMYIETMMKPKLDANLSYGSVATTQSQLMCGQSYTTLQPQDTERYKTKLNQIRPH